MRHDRVPGALEMTAAESGPAVESGPAAEAGPAAEYGSAVLDRVGARLTRVGIISNALGASLVALFLLFLAPSTIDVEELEGLLLASTVAFGVYMAITLPLGRTWAHRRFVRLAGWLRDERPATEAERQAVLGYPLGFAGVAAVFWGIAAILFPLPFAAASPAAGVAMAFTIVLGGMTACALQFLLVERTMRPITARALAGGPPPPRCGAPGVGARLTMAWVLGTGVPLLGVVAFAVAALMGADLDETRVMGATLFLALLALGVGLLAIRLAARSVADPVDAVQRGLERVQEGDLEAHVPVDDGSEVGLLQAGFNRMAAGLSERERMRDLFGRHVGREVARVALEGEVRLGGELRPVGVLFVDVVGSTSLTAERPPAEVVALLNDFFCIVVEVVERHGGWVNKFEGDAALCVFGAPTAREDPAGDALRAARELRARLLDELLDVDVGIGVSAGPAVAGNIGAEQRFEYTVIGDPVNEAARLCELAKGRPERLLASDSAVSQADSSEAEHWWLGEAVTLRGRASPTRLATAAAGAVRSPESAAWPTGDGREPKAHGAKNPRPPSSARNARNG